MEYHKFIQMRISKPSLSLERAWFAFNLLFRWLKNVNNADQFNWVSVVPLGRWINTCFIFISAGASSSISTTDAGDTPANQVETLEKATYSLTHTCGDTHTHTLLQTQTPTQTQTHSCKHTRTHTNTNTSTNTLEKSRRHDMYLSLLFCKECLKWLSMTCHKSCFSRHGKKDAWEIYTRSRVFTVWNQNWFDPVLKQLKWKTELIYEEMISHDCQWESNSLENKKDKEPQHSFHHMSNSDWQVRPLASQWISPGIHQCLC